MTTISQVLSLNFANRLWVVYDIYMDNCVDCGKSVKYGNRCKSCSKKGILNPMYNKKGKDNPTYRGGFIHKTLGYKIVQHEGKKSYEHRVIAETILGRKLEGNEVVHHVNHNKLDNRPENLIITTQSKHLKQHAKDRLCCRKGHLYSDVGAYTTEGSRRCKKCTKDKVRRYAH